MAAGFLDIFKGLITGKTFFDAVNVIKNPTNALSPTNLLSPTYDKGLSSLMSNPLMLLALMGGKGRGNNNMLMMFMLMSMQGNSGTNPFPSININIPSLTPVTPKVPDSPAKPIPIPLNPIPVQPPSIPAYDGTDPNGTNVGNPYYNIYPPGYL